MTLIKSHLMSKDFDPYLFVKFEDETHVTPATAASDNLIGIKTNVPALKDKAGDVVWLGEAELKLGGTVKAGDRLTSDANGCGVVAAGTTVEITDGDSPTATASADVVKAIARTDGVAGDIIPVCVV